MERSTPAMRRNGGMGWRETRKGLTSFRSLLALSPALSSSSLSSLFPSRFPLYHLLLRISRQHTLSSLPCLFSLFLSISLCLSLLLHLFFSPFFSFEAKLEPTLACATYCLPLLCSPWFPAIYYSSTRKIYIRLTAHT